MPMPTLSLIGQFDSFKKYFTFCFQENVLFIKVFHDACQRSATFGQMLTRLLIYSSGHRAHRRSGEESRREGSRVPRRTVGGTSEYRSPQVCEGRSTSRRSCCWRLFVLMIKAELFRIMCVCARVFVRVCVLDLASVSVRFYNKTRCVKTSESKSLSFNNS